MSVLPEDTGRVKVYFACSIRGGRSKAEVYDALIKLLSKRTTVLSEAFGDTGLTSAGTQGLSSRAIHDQDLAWVREADLIIAEVSVPSLGVGYEVAHAQSWGKPVLALYDGSEGGHLSAMIDGAPGLQVVVYMTEAEAERAVERFLDEQLQLSIGSRMKKTGPGLG